MATWRWKYTDLIQIPSTLDHETHLTIIDLIVPNIVAGVDVNSESTLYSSLGRAKWLWWMQFLMPRPFPWSLTRKVSKCHFHLNVNLMAASLKLAWMLRVSREWWRHEKPKHFHMYFFPFPSISLSDCWLFLACFKTVLPIFCSSGTVATQEGISVLFITGTISLPLSGSCIRHCICICTSLHRTKRAKSDAMVATIGIFWTMDCWDDNKTSLVQNNFWMG